VRTSPKYQTAGVSAMSRIRIDVKSYRNVVSLLASNVVGSKNYNTLFVGDADTFARIHDGLPGDGVELDTFAPVARLGQLFGVAGDKHALKAFARRRGM